MKYQIKEQKESSLFKPIEVPPPLPLPNFDDDDDGENWDTDPAVTM